MASTAEARITARTGRPSAGESAPRAPAAPPTSGERAARSRGGDTDQARGSGVQHPRLEVTCRCSSPAAHEARGIVNAAGSLGHRKLWVRAKRTRPIDGTVGGMRRGNLIGRFAVLDPLLERGNHVERVWSFAAAAMAHSRRHEQSIRSVNLGDSAERVYDARVVLRTVRRRNLRIGPAVKLNELAAMVDERFQVGIQRIERVAIGFLRPREIAIEIELLDVPRGIVEDEETELIEPRGSSGLRPSQVSPSELAARQQAADLAPGRSIHAR